MMVRRSKIPRGKVSKHLRLLRSLSLFEVSGRSSPLEEDLRKIDWSILTELAVSHRVIPQMYLNVSKMKSLGSLQIPSDVFDGLHLMYSEQVRRDFQLSNLITKVLEVFSENGIKSLLVKGAAVAYYGYLFPNIREMDDIDILLEDEPSLVRGRNLMRNMGLVDGKVSYLKGDHRERVVKSEHDFHGKPTIDLHLDIGSRCTYLPGSLLWSKAVEAFDEGPLITSPEDTLLVTCANAVSNGRFLLRDLLDTVAVLSKKRGIDWTHVLKKGELLNLLHPLSSLVVLASRLGNLSSESRNLFLPYLARFRGYVLDAENVGDSGPSLSLDWYRRKFFLIPQLGYLHPIKDSIADTKEIVQSWVRREDAFGGLTYYASWKSKEIIKRLTEYFSIRGDHH